MAVSRAAASLTTMLGSSTPAHTRAQDDTSGTSFAAVLAGAAHSAHAAKQSLPTPPKQAAHSDLDGTDDEGGQDSTSSGTVRDSRDSKAPSANGDSPPVVSAPTNAVPFTPAMSAAAAFAPTFPQALAAQDESSQGATTTIPGASGARAALEAQAHQTMRAIAGWHQAPVPPVDATAPTLAMDAIDDAPALQAGPTVSPTDLSPSAKGGNAQNPATPASLPSLATIATGAGATAIAATAQAGAAVKGASVKNATTTSLADGGDSSTTTATGPTDARAASVSHAMLETTRAVVSALDASGLGGGGGQGTDARLAFAPPQVMLNAGVSDGSADGAAAAQATTSTDRVLAALDARERGAPSAVSHIIMNLDSPEGDAERVQVSMRGSTVATAIDTTSIANAEQMAARANDLATSLAHQGLDAAQLQVRATSLGAVPQSSSTSSSSDYTPRYERSFTWQQGRQRAQDGRQGGRQQRGGQSE